MSGRIRVTTYMGRVIRVSERTHIRLNTIKDRRGYRNMDSVIDNALRKSGLLLQTSPEINKKRPRKRIDFFDSEGFGI